MGQKNKTTDRRGLQKAVRTAVEAFLGEKPGLLELEAHEQAISHRIAFHLETLIRPKEPGKLTIDCEYNKHLDAPKKMKLNWGQIPRREAGLCKCSACKAILKDEQPEVKRFRPDILFHERNTDANNRLAVEIKAGKSCPFDKEKLRTLTRARGNGGEYHYDLGVFIQLQNGKPLYSWFEEGTEMDLI